MPHYFYEAIIFKNKMEENNYEPKTSEQFNMSLAILERLNALINLSAIAGAEKDFPKWFKYLSALKNQLSYKFTDDEDLDAKAYSIIITPLLKEFENKLYFDKEDKKFILIKGESFEDYNKLYIYLENYQKLILSIMDKRDMLSIKKEESGLF